MGYWDERIENSDALKQARQLDAWLNEPFEEGVVVTNEEQDYLDRGKVVIGMAVDQLLNTDPYLVTDSVLTTLAAAIADANTYMLRWREGQGIEPLKGSAQSSLDTVVTAISQLPERKVPDTVEAIARLRRSVAQHRRAVDREIESLSSASGAAQTAISEKADEIKTSVEALRIEVATADAELKRIEATSSELASKQQTAFSKAETDRSTAFDGLLSEKRAELEAAVIKLEGETADRLAKSETTISDQLAEATKSKERIEKILGIVGQESLIADYSKTAIDDRRQATRWRWFAVLSIGSAVALAMYLAKAVSKDGTNWKYFAAKVIAAASLGTLAAYAAQQSAEHRHAQRRAERMALQLSTLKPYLQDLDDPVMRDGLLKQIAGELFTNKEPLLSVGKNSRHGKSNSPNMVAQLVEVVSELVSKSK